jgi:hypothetical protein
MDFATILQAAGMSPPTATSHTLLVCLFSSWLACVLVEGERENRGTDRVKLWLVLGSLPRRKLRSADPTSAKILELSRVLDVRCLGQQVTTFLHLPALSGKSTPAADVSSF